MRRYCLLMVILCVALFMQTVAAENRPDSEAFPEIRARLARLVEQKEYSGAVTMIVSPKGVLHLNAVGEADVDQHLPMKTDSIFFIASMTKPITGLAVCKLEEEGKLKLDDLVEKYIAEFSQLKNAEGEPVQVTILQLLTHTSGLREADRTQTHHLLTLEELIPYYVSAPVQFQPGTQWKYCQSSIDTAGRIVEILSGLPFDEYLAREFFEPLGMADTTFFLNEAQVPRLAQTYRRTKDGRLEVEKNHLLLRFGKSPGKRDRVPFPSMGLFSTAPDYARLCRMLLNEGELDGRRLLKPETVRRYHTVHTQELLTTPGNGWGVGVAVVREPQGITAKLSPGTFGHGGAYGTQSWIDPERKVAWVLMVQRSDFSNAARRAFHDVFFSQLP